MVLNIFKLLLCSFYIFLSLYIAGVKGKLLTELKEINKLASDSPEIISKSSEETAEQTSTAVTDTVVVNSVEPKLHIYPDGNPIVVPANVPFGLTCEGKAEDAEFTDMKWFFFNATDYFEIRDNLRKIESSKLYLGFPAPKAEDSGNYTCSATFNKTEILLANVQVEFYDDDPCSNVTICRNRGQCIRIGENFQCICKTPFSGRFCERDPCSDEPCMNGGKCWFSRQNFYCNCKEPYTGKYCEVNLCPVNLCKNGGLCRPIQGEGQCFCKEPYSGKYCDIRMDDCATNNICRNGGICRTINYEKKCFCVEPYGGKYCDIKADARYNRTAYVVMFVLLGLVLISVAAVCILSCALCRRVRQAKTNRTNH